MNIWGQVVGQSRIPNGDGDGRGFRTGPNQAIVPTSALSEIFLDDQSGAHGLNDGGVAVGVSSWDHTAVMWPLVPPFQVWSIGGLNDAVVSSANAVNNFGVAVGKRFTGPVNLLDYGDTQAWVFTQASLLLTGWSDARDINDHGVVVGWVTSNSSLPPRASRWSGGPGVEDLGTLDPTCTTCGSWASAINDRGTIVGASEFIQLHGLWHAFAKPDLRSQSPTPIGIGDSVQRLQPLPE